MQATTLDQLRAEASHQLRIAANPSPEDNKSTALQRVAKAFVAARAEFHGDWFGRSYAYKRWVADVYADAGIPVAERARFRASVGYHVSSALHARFTDEELESLGFNRKSLRERREVRRDRELDVLATLNAPHPDPSAVERILAPMFARMPAEQREILAQRLTATLLTRSTPLAPFESTQ